MLDKHQIFLENPLTIIVNAGIMNTALKDDG